MVNLLDKGMDNIHTETKQKSNWKPRKGQAAYKKAAKLENGHPTAARLWQQKPVITEKPEKDQNSKEIHTAWEKTTSRCIVS